MLAKEQRTGIPISRPGLPLALHRTKIKRETPPVSARDSAVRKRCAPGRIIDVIDTEGIVRFVQEGSPIHRAFLREPGKLKK